jgi:hypothetical protein
VISRFLISCFPLDIIFSMYFLLDAKPFIYLFIYLYENVRPEKKERNKTQIRKSNKGWMLHGETHDKFRFSQLRSKVKRSNEKCRK